MRERVGSLRFAIGELQFDRQRTDLQQRIDIEKDLEMLERRLTAVHEQYQREHDSLFERELALTASRAELQERRGRSYQRLTELVDELAGEAESELSIAPLIDRYRTIRDLVRGRGRAG
jgi:hypothetical protein